jgi:predicted nucleotidyltransferase component of viral defense system
MNVFDQMMARYTIRTEDDQINAIREIMQQIALAGLYRGGFFNKAAFYGGTCLSIFYGSERFSEDMDFSLLKKEPNFDPSRYFESIINEFNLAGKEVVIEKKQKKLPSQIESAFLKEGTQVYDLHFTTQRKVKIKIEVDINPPGGFQTEYKLLLMPFSFMSRCFSLPSLFAGKMHAILYRSWKRRVKGRDWYDLIWYVKQGVPLHIGHFYERAIRSGDLQNYPSPQIIRELLKARINITSIEMIKADIMPFIKDPQQIDIYSTDFFHQLIDMIKWQEG